MGEMENEYAQWGSVSAATAPVAKIPRRLWATMICGANWASKMRPLPTGWSMWLRSRLKNERTH